MMDQQPPRSEPTRWRSFAPMPSDLLLPPPLWQVPTASPPLRRYARTWQTRAPQQSPTGWPLQRVFEKTVFTLLPEKPAVSLGRVVYGVGQKSRRPVHIPRVPSSRRKDTMSPFAPSNASVLVHISSSSCVIRSCSASAWSSAALDAASLYSHRVCSVSNYIISSFLHIQ